MPKIGVVVDGVCSDCGHTIQVGEWPFACGGHGDHILYMRLSFMPSGRTVDYAPPTPISPIKEPQMTRTWLNPDGSTREMHPREWCRTNAVDMADGVKEPSYLR